MLTAYYADKMSQISFFFRNETFANPLIINQLPNRRY